jgi:hypothetical protein
MSAPSSPVASVDMCKSSNISCRRLNTGVSVHICNDISDASKIAVDENDTDDEGLPQISLQEMLDDLHISSKEASEHRKTVDLLKRGSIHMKLLLTW